MNAICYKSTLHHYHLKIIILYNIGLQIVMKFTEETYREIEFLGLKGSSFFKISSDLGMMPCELRDLRLKDKKLDEALKNAEFYHRQFVIEKIEQNVLNGMRLTPLAKEIYRQFRKLNAHKDM